MSSKGEIIDAVRLVQLYNLQLYKYLISGLVENSLTVSKLKVEFDEYTSLRMKFFAMMGEQKIPFVTVQKEHINAFLDDVKRNDKLRQELYKTQRSLWTQGDMDWRVPIAIQYMILEDFPELCVSTSPDNIPLKVLCDQIYHMYNVHNVEFDIDILRLTENDNNFMSMSKPEQTKPCQPKPKLPSVRSTTAETLIAESSDVAPEAARAGVKATIFVNDDINMSNSVDGLIEESLQPVSTCDLLQPIQADVPKMDKKSCDQPLSVLKGIPELNQDNCSLVKTSPTSASTHKPDITIPALLKSPIHNATGEKKVAGQDNKGYPQCTTRTDPVISWDELIDKFEKLAIVDDQEHSAEQESTDIQEETPKPNSTSQTEKSPGSQKSVVPCQPVDVENQDLPLTTDQENCKKLNSSISSQMVVPNTASSKGTIKPTVELFKNKTQRRQHTPKNPTENLTTAESLKYQQKRAEQLASLELKRLKTQSVLNELYNKSCDGKDSAPCKKTQPQPTVEKTTKLTATTVLPKHQTQTQVKQQTQARVVNLQPTQVTSQPAVSQSRKRPVPSLVNTGLSAPAAKRARQSNYRIILNKCSGRNLEC